jgi:transposase
LAARRGKKKALIAIGHSILKSVYHILKNNVEYKELGAEYLDGKLEAKRKKYLQNELKKLGFEVSLTPMPLQQTGT